MTEKTPVVHNQRNDHDIYIGRGPGQTHFLECEIGARGWLGNPYTLDEHSRQESVMRFASDLFCVLFTEQDEEYQAAIAALSGKKLGCWCRDKNTSPQKTLCHGDVIAFAADLMQIIQSQRALTGEDQ